MKVLAENKQAKFDYKIIQTHEAGVELLGFEVKAAKSGKMNLAGSYARVKGNQVWLINATIVVEVLIFFFQFKITYFHTVNF